MRQGNLIVSILMLMALVMFVVFTMKHMLIHASASLIVLFILAAYLRSSVRHTYYDYEAEEKVAYYVGILRKASMAFSLVILGVGVYALIFINELIGISAIIIAIVTFVIFCLKVFKYGD